MSKIVKETGAADAVPPRTMHRLAAVLQHLRASRGPVADRACPAHHSSNPCSGAEAKVIDVEDLAAPARNGRRHSGHHLDDDPQQLFDPKRYAATQRPLLEAYTLPSECYNSFAWFERECERVFMPSWTLIGREDEIAEPGRYLAMDTEWGGPVAVCRGRDGAIHAFANVCKHRGAKVVQGTAGKGPDIGLVCPYHAWTYDFDGQLKWAPGMDNALGFEESGVRLTPVRAEIFHGFIFINMADTAISLAESLGDLPEKMAPWFGPKGTAQFMTTVARREYTVDCNWKFLMENTCETYHTAVVHKGSLGPMKAKPMEPHRGDWDAVRVPSNRSIVPLPTDFKGEQFPLPAFTDSTNFTNLFPSLQINVTWDCLWWMRLLPLGPEKTHIQMGFCFPVETTKLERFPCTLEHYLKRWHIAVCEDNEISLNQQRGVRSVFREPGRFHPLEFATHNFNNWLLSKVLDGAQSCWDPGNRVFVGHGEIWSNDDEDLRTVLYEAETAAARSNRPMNDKLNA